MERRVRSHGVEWGKGGDSLKASPITIKPNNGLLLQSLLYNTHGGTCGTQAESKLYLDLVQRELSELEGVPSPRQSFAENFSESAVVADDVIISNVGK